MDLRFIHLGVHLDTPLGTGEHRRTQTYAALRIVAQRCGGWYGSPRVSAQRARARINTTHTRARVLHQDISYQQIIRSDLWGLVSEMCRDHVGRRNHLVLH